MISPKLGQTLKWLAIALFLGLSVWLLVRHLSHYRPAEIWQQLQALPLAAIALAFLFVTLSLSAMIQFDVIAVRWLRPTIRYGQIALAGFIGGVFGRTIGYPLLTTSGVRYRLYRAWGLSPGQIAQLITLYFASLWLGFFTIAGVAMIAQPLTPPASWPDALPSSRWIGVLLIVPVVGYLLVSFFRRKPWRLLRFEIPLPPPLLALSQVGFSSAKWLLNAGTLYVLMNAVAPLDFIYFTAVYFAAQLIAIISHAPGGYAVFDASILLLLDPVVPPPAIAGSLVAYRALYNLLPLAVAVPLYLVAEARLNLDAKRSQLPHD